ncbi:hypothetical protein LWI29_021813 [Acer saccharum]|uniref:Retrotransposon Copia-like N-terminal domain-containing protein n=1 Tax=Acer saccharum TaxID=4024 RepID=A0AA39W6U9_ACESA|nr:hypothetical protein LWI29_021813 [Acer saccharum]
MASSSESLTTSTPFSTSTIFVTATSPHHIANLIPIKLTRENYLLWKSVFIPILQNSDLYSFLDGSDPCPPKTLPTDLPNPAYATWVTRDLKRAVSNLEEMSNSLMQYLEQIKPIADGLAVARAPLDDLDLIAHTLRGLPSKFDSFGTSIRVHVESIDLDALHGLLINEEIELQQHDTLALPDSTSSL